MSRIMLILLLVVSFVVGLIVGNQYMGNAERDRSIELEQRLEQRKHDLLLLRRQRDEAIVAKEEAQAQSQSQVSTTAQVPSEEQESAPATEESEPDATASDDDDAQVQALEAQLAQVNRELEELKSTLVDVETAAQIRVGALLEDLAATEQAQQSKDTALADISALADAKLAESALALEEAKAQGDAALENARAQAAEAIKALETEKDAAIAQLTQQMQNTETLAADLQNQLGAALGQIDQITSELMDAEGMIETLRNAPPVQFVIDGVAEAVGQ